ncbi:MAG TPA: AsmA family protein [Vitreimonas sp.]|uniref:AsmA family protein n=1 Tax=Vitreimonas sp. TaxID=3069702 RepID=UPI002D635989|nr:AsmA family protein [Vitreimonas sp.]HYD86307.1 AsmA family protein [Vitreimonas sp.]
MSDQPKPKGKLKLNLKTIGVGAGVLLVALVLLVVGFIAFFPKELAAREAERRIEEATERDLVLGGEIDVSFWPALGFSVANASLSNPEGFPADHPFIAADRIVFAVKVMPLLRGAIEVKELIFEGAEVRMIAEADGGANWIFPTRETPEDQFTLDDLRLDDVRMIDSLISFQGAEGGAPLVLEDVDAGLALESLDAPARLDAEFDYRGERLDLEGTVRIPRAMLEKGQTPLAANVRSALLDASFDGAFDAASGALTGRVDARGDSLRRLLAWFGSPMAEGGGFGRFSLAAQMARQGETTALTSAALQLDEIEAQGNLNLLNQENGRLRIAGGLTTERVDLNTYLPAPAQGREASGVEVGSSWSQDSLDLSGLRALDADLDLTIGALQFQRMRFTNVALDMRIANGALDAQLTRIALYDGAGVARMIADGSGAVPRIAIEIDAQNIQAEPLLRDAIGFDKITGRGRLTASLVGHGASQAAIMRSMRGSAAFAFNDGQWKGINLAQVARTVQAVVSGEAVGAGAATDFAELAANFTVADGVAATDNLRLLNPFVRLEGRGLINIGAQTIDMRLAPRAVRSIEGQGGQAGVAGLGIPFRITGPWSRVSFRPAIEDVVQQQLRNVLSQQESGSPLGRLGDALFGRTPAAETPAPATETPTPAAEGETPAAPAPQERPRNPLEDIFRRAVEGQREQPKQEEPAPTP